MRGRSDQSDELFSFVRLEDRVPSDHPLRAIRTLTDEVLASLSGRLDVLYARVGRPSIPPEMLLRATLLQAFFSIRSERMLMEQINYNLLVRGFLHGQCSLGPLDVYQEPGSPAGSKVAHRFFAEVLSQADGAGLLSREHSVSMAQ